MKGIRPDHVPADRIMPFVKEYIEQYDRLTGSHGLPKAMRVESRIDTFGGSNDPFGNSFRFHYMSGTGVLAREAGISEDSLYRYTMGRYKWMKFDVADRLLCAMNRVDLWHSELSDIYWTVPLYDKTKCENPDCSEPPVKIKDVGSRWCSQRCRHLSQKLEKKLAQAA